METAKHQAREAQQEIRGLKARSARTLGDEVAAEHLEHSMSSAAVKDLHAHVEQLLANEVDLRGRLRETVEELEAARRLPHADARPQLQLHRAAYVTALRVGGVRIEVVDALQRWRDQVLLQTAPA